ncbi:helix-turn-helix domain-containing protein [Croceibacterium aestuarii]|uniref:helix-turn-helix domain-containing protein n=1 Tax=Croceibacterium aestuarii TaxID=3064139 RepID=UPI00272E5751|nr:helix-turn-helix domain-containing protein [Croceibacterium sp. D39]
MGFEDVGVERQTHSEKGGSIRSVERAIDVLRALNRRPFSTLHDLHCDTGLPKPSLVRLLRTLEAKGLATRSSTYGAYRLLGSVKSLSSGFHHEPRIVEVAEIPMIEFTRREGWPLSLALFDLDAMVVRACTIRFTAMSLEHAALERRLSLLSHAMGRAYLAHSARHEQEILLSILRRNQQSGVEPPMDDEAVSAMIARVRECGYAFRDPLCNPRSSTIAVPVFENGSVLATLGFTWISAAMTPRQAAERYVPGLTGLAREISAQLEGPSPEPFAPQPAPIGSLRSGPRTAAPMFLEAAT